MGTQSSYKTVLSPCFVFVSNRPRTWFEPASTREVFNITTTTTAVSNNNSDNYAQDDGNKNNQPKPVPMAVLCFYFVFWRQLGCSTTTYIIPHRCFVILFVFRRNKRFAGADKRNVTVACVDQTRSSHDPFAAKWKVRVVFALYRFVSTKRQWSRVSNNLLYS